MKDWSCRSNVSTFLKMRSWHYFAATDLLATYFALSKSWLADPHFHFHIKLYMHFHNPGHCSSFLYLLIHQWICIPLHLHNSCYFEDKLFIKIVYLKSSILFCLFPVLHLDLSSIVAAGQLFCFIETYCRMPSVLSAVGHSPASPPSHLRPCVPQHCMSWPWIATDWLFGELPS